MKDSAIKSFRMQICCGCPYDRILYGDEKCHASNSDIEECTYENTYSMEDEYK